MIQWLRENPISAGLGSVFQGNRFSIICQHLVTKLQSTRENYLLIPSLVTTYKTLAITMLRSTQPLFRSSARAVFSGKVTHTAVTRFTTLNASREQNYHPNGSRERQGMLQLSAFRTYSTKPPLQPNKIDKEREKELGQRKLESHPESVSATSTPLGGLAPPEQGNADASILKDVKGDLVSTSSKSCRSRH